MLIIFRIFVVKIKSLQKTVIMHNFYAKIQKSSVMTKFFLALPRPSIFMSVASKVRKNS